MRYSRSLLHNHGGERSINNNSIRNIYFYPDSIAINSLDIRFMEQQLGNNK